MTSLLDDANRLLDLQYGDIPRLKQIKEILEQNKMLNVSERKYLCKLVQETSEKPIQTSKKIFEENSTKTDSDMDIDELEEKIRVEMEPS